MIRRTLFKKSICFSFVFASLFLAAGHSERCNPDELEDTLC
jgi:hypothetical protein